MIVVEQAGSTALLLLPSDCFRRCLLDLKDYRNQLDQIDDQILTLLHQRAEIVKKVGELKSRIGAESVYVPHREKEILSRLKTQNRDRFPPEALETIYTEIIPRAGRSKNHYPLRSSVLLAALGMPRVCATLDHRQNSSP